jgi:hypothetical protein
VPDDQSIVRELAVEARRRQHMMWYSIAVLIALVGIGVAQLFFR